VSQKREDVWGNIHGFTGNNLKKEMDARQLRIERKDLITSKNGPERAATFLKGETLMGRPTVSSRSVRGGFRGGNVLSCKSVCEGRKEKGDLISGKGKTSVRVVNEERESREVGSRNHGKRGSQHQSKIESLKKAFGTWKGINFRKRGQRNNRKETIPFIRLEGIRRER